jgi:ABC-2 type transport system permease protein
MSIELDEAGTHASGSNPAQGIVAARNGVRSVRVTLSISMRRSLAQRGGLAVKGLFYALVFSILASLWRSAAHANGGFVAGYSAAALTWYMAMSEAVTISMNSRLLADVGADITSGAVSIELLRPKSVVLQRVLIETGRVVVPLAVCTLTGFLVCWFVVGLPPSGAGFALALPSLVLAVMCNIVAHHAFAAVAFWLRETGATWFLYQKLVFMTGGMLLPLEVLPHWLHRAALFTPFPSMAYAPARLGSGHAEPGLLAVQVGWLIALSLLAKIAFALGERRLEVVGG